MAIYHLNANVISRARGQSIVAAAAYRSGARLRDERYGTVHNYTAKRVVAHTEIMAPAGVAAWVHDREMLWNRVEASEHRKDSQLARVIEIGLPLELTHDESVALVREYVAALFVARGMIADFCIRRDNPGNPQVHILLTLRGVTAQGFGPKDRRWNGKANLLEWRASWAHRTNEHLARSGHSVRIDHRTLEAQQIELTPSRRIGFGRSAASGDELPGHLVERIAEQRRIARDNGVSIVEDPTVALRALTHQSPTFTAQDLRRFMRSRTDGDQQFLAAQAMVTQSADLVALPAIPGGDTCFTSRDMLDAAKSLQHRAVTLANRPGHALTMHGRAYGLAKLPVAVDDDLRRGFEYLVGDGDAKALAIADQRTRQMLIAAVHETWSEDGLQITRVTSQTLSATEDAWQRGHDPLTKSGVLVVEGAEMIALKPLERALAVADRARAKVVLIADAVLLRIIGEHSAFRSIVAAIGAPAYSDSDRSSRPINS